MISIIIPLFNKEKELISTLESVFSQSVDDYEIVMVDDGSTDDSVKTVREFTDDKRLRIVSQKNSGVGAARNEGIRNARYDLIAFIDADDLWHPEYLETQLGLADKFPEAGLFATEYEMLGTDGKSSPAKINEALLGFDGVEGIIKDYFHIASNSNPPLWTSAVMVRKESLLNVGGFPEGVKSGEDLLTWARLAYANKIAYSKRRLATYVLGHSIPRPPEERDVVGDELEKLYKSSRGHKSMRRYIALWCRMRMSRCLAVRMYGKSFNALFKAMRYRPFDLGLYHAFLKFFVFGIKNKN